MAETEGQVGFEQIGIANVLNRHLLTVPPNQREYAWEDQHVQNLLEDVAKAIADGDKTYFLGTIVTVPRDDGRLEVVDGQQRLATTALFLDQVARYLKASETVIAESIRNDFLSKVDRKLREEVPRLTMNLDDNDFFKATITGQTPAPKATRNSHERIRSTANSAAKYVRAIVDGRNPNDHGDLLNTWVEFLQHKATVILLKVPSDANAYRMFETLNDRGLRTSQADLIKNYLLGSSGARLSEVQQKWTLMRGMLDSLDGDDITIDFLRHALIVTNGFVREPQLYETVQRIAKSPQQCVTLASSLETLSGLYIAIQNPEHERWNSSPDSTRRAIEVLNLLNINSFRPLMLAAASRFSASNLDKTYRFLVSLGVRLFIASTTRSGTIEQALSAAAAAIESKQVRTAVQLRTALKDITPKDEVFKEAFEKAKVSNGKLARYYLRSLEVQAAGKADPWHIPNSDKTVINLEHVLPRHPDGKWPAFPTDEDVRDNVTRLGNQVLLNASQNSTIGNSDFAAKLPVLKAAPYKLTSIAAAAADWNAAEIDARQKVLASHATKTWPIT